jgi:hypothetical protein
MATTKGFGKFVPIEGKMGVHSSSVVPVELLQRLKSNVPLPISITATTFVLNGGVTEPVAIWNGNDFTTLRETLTYTFINGTNTTFLNSSGVTTAAQVTAATVYYFYAGLSTTGALQMYPSSSAPSYVEGPYQGNHWSHPGTTRDKYWSYVGFSQNTATTPSFALLQKRGFLYHNPTPTAMGVINVAQDTTVAAAISLANLVPVHSGVKMYGWAAGATDAAGSNIWLGSTSLAAQEFQIATASVAAVRPAIGNVGPLTPDSSAQLWAYAQTTLAAGGQVNITVIEDVV